MVRDLQSPEPRFRPTIPDRRRAMPLFRRQLWRLLELSSLSRERSPLCLCSRETARKCLSCEILQPSEHRLLALRLRDCDKCQKLLCSFLPCCFSLFSILFSVLLLRFVCVFATDLVLAYNFSSLCFNCFLLVL